jgi:hypothetical protein
MPGIPQTLAVPPPVSPNWLINAIRVALVNTNHPGAITYDPLAKPPPPVNTATLWWGVYNAAQGQLQS